MTRPVLWLDYDIHGAAFDFLDFLAVCALMLYFRGLQLARLRSLRGEP